MEHNNYITWKAFFSIVLALIVAMGTPVCGAIAWGWSDLKAETRTQVKDSEIRLNSQVQRIENKLDVVLDYLIQHDDL